MSNTNPLINFTPTKLMEYPFIIPTEKWIRIYIHNQLVAESYSPLLLINDYGRQLVYFFQPSEVNKEFFVESTYTGRNNMFQYWHILINGKQVDNAALTYTDNTQGEFKKLIGRIGFKWNAISKITEEDEILIGHPRNPFHRIDTRSTSRLIQFKIGDEIIAESTHSIALFETDYRVRYYIPIVDIKMEYLEKTKTTSICPYKGIASYWSIKLNNETYEDVAWSYLNPFVDAYPIKELICFWKINLFVNNEYKGNY